MNEPFSLLTSTWSFFTPDYVCWLRIGSHGRALQLGCLMFHLKTEKKALLYLVLFLKKLQQDSELVETLL